MQIRFWVPVVVLALIAAHSSQKLIRAHLDPEVKSIKYEFERDIIAPRGCIYDCCGHSLARSVPFWDYHLDPVALTNRVVKNSRREPRRPPLAIVKTIATALGLPYAKVKAMSEDVKHLYQPLGLSRDQAAHDILANSKLVAGVVIEDRQVRQYIHRNRFSHVVGFVNAMGVGSAGVEQRYDRLLTGTPGRIRGMRDAHGRELYDKRVVSIDPIPGADVYLTLDQNIQYEAQTALADGLREYGAGSGWCLILNAKTGAVLAMVSLPDFIPEAYGRAKEDHRLNRTCAFTYEPGSVMKVITAATGIEAGLVSPDSLYSTNRDDDRYYRLPGDGSHVWEPRMTVRDALVHSSNIVIGKLGVDIGPARLWKSMRSFGFGQKTGLELPGEESGILPHWKKWDKVKWSRAPIGQGIAVTAIQLASAYQAIANDGLRMKPHIVKKIVAADGMTLYEHVDEPLGRPISARTARLIRESLLGVASREGTARRAAMKGYSVSGKTGTAQKVINRHYSDHLFRATFCGMVPASAPELVILVTLDFDQRAKYHQGGNSSGPVFRRIATAVLRYLMVAPDRPEELVDIEDASDEYEQMQEERARGL